MARLSLLFFFVLLLALACFTPPGTADDHYKPKSEVEQDYKYKPPKYYKPPPYYKKPPYKKPPYYKPPYYKPPYYKPPYKKPPYGKYPPQKDETHV